jgi:hypothetical protein
MEEDEKTIGILLGMINMELAITNKELLKDASDGWKTKLNNIRASNLAKLFMRFQPDEQTKREVSEIFEQVTDLY